MLTYYDNTKIKTFRECPRKYYFRHVRHWTIAKPSISIAFGLSWHRMMDIVWSVPEESTVEEALQAWTDCMRDNSIPVDSPTFSFDFIQNIGTAEAMLKNYIKRYYEFLHEIELIDVERPFVVPISNKQNVAYAGKLDKVYRTRQQVKIIDHKSTAAYARDGGFRNTFLESFSPDSQIDGYNYAGHMLYENFAGVVIDAALVHKTEHNKFIMIPVTRRHEVLDQWLYETNHWITAIEAENYRLHNHKPEANILRAFPRNTSSCFSYGSSCAYRDFCTFRNNPEHITDVPDGYIKSEWNPFDKEALELAYNSMLQVR